MAKKLRRFLGRHLLVELFDCKKETLNDYYFVRKSALEAAKKAHATIVRVVTHNFSPQGISVVIVIAESHISLHTWPEYQYVAADIFTCGKRTNPRLAAESLIESFGAKRYCIREYHRGLFGSNAIRSN